MCVCVCVDKLSIRVENISVPISLPLPPFHLYAMLVLCCRYSFIVVMMDRVFLINSWPFLVKHFRGSH